MNIEALKLELVNKIMALKDAYDLMKIKATLKDMSSTEEIIKRLSKPTRKSINIEQLKKEQNYQPINKKELFAKIDALNIEEPLDELLQMI